MITVTIQINGENLTLKANMGKADMDTDTEFVLLAGLSLLMENLSDEQIVPPSDNYLAKLWVTAHSLGRQLMDTQKKKPSDEIIL
jgi:hypothetical protein